MPGSAVASTGRDRTVRRARAKFLRFYPDGFRDEWYLESERGYKWQAHRRWATELNRPTVATMLAEGRFKEIADRATRIEGRTNLLFSFEKMAIRDAVASEEGAEQFARGLSQWLYGSGSEQRRFEAWCEVLAQLPVRQTRVATWPVATVFGFIARPRVHILLKPMVTRAAAAAYGFDFEYRPTLQWDTYNSLIEFGRTVRDDVADLAPHDMIDIQSFIWVQGSDEYAG